MKPLRSGRILLRTFVAIGLVGGLAVVTYLLLVPFVLVGTDEYRGSLAVGLLGGVTTIGLLGLQALRLAPALSRLTNSVRSGEIPDPFDREKIYAAPRRAAGLMVVMGLVILASGYVPLGGPLGQERTLATNVGAVCAALAAGVLYAAIRYALRPLVEVLRDDPYVHLDLDANPMTRADRAATRVALAIAVPAGAAALVATLMVSAHLVAIYDDQERAARESFTQALNVGRRPGESAAGIAVAASALAGGHVAVAEQNGEYVVPPVHDTTPQPPFWSIPIALALGIFAGQLGRRIGENASMDLETAARRMAVVGVRDIRSVTMSMARPRSIPEIREAALALDTLAATLLRMADDQKRALTVRTEAARVRSFVLASVSHDLRGPLNAVLGFAELLLSGVEGALTDGQRESLDALSRGGRDLLRLVGDLLDHARIDAGRMTVDRTLVSVDSVVERARVAAIERSKGPVSAEDIVIEGETGLAIIADEERLGHAIGALAAFALLRPGGDGRVVIRMLREGDRVVIAIRGRGRPLSREALSRMFEPFDFAPSGARAPAGLNLAVSVARGIAQLHGAEVSAEPHDEGGVLLVVSFPPATT